MSKDTHIEWCDSSLNLMMGCDGCELWTKKLKHCYAGELTNRYGGRKGYPVNFETPTLFLDRLDASLKWPDLTGTDRPDKPWLNGLPRTIFLNDMGDTFTESLPLDWLAPILPRLADSPHVWMILTKRGGRMLEFSRQHPFPSNVWPGVSVTNETTLARANSLLQVHGGGVKWISAEPLLGSIDIRDYIDEDGIDHEMPAKDGIGWLVAGGESGTGARKTSIADIYSLVNQCRGSIPIFVKQVGSKPMMPASKSLPIKDPKGGDPAEWPEEIRCREMPKVTVAA